MIAHVHNVCLQAPCFKSKFITAELAHLFSQSDSEEEFEGFSDGEEEEEGGCFNERLKTKVWNIQCMLEANVCGNASEAPTWMLFHSILLQMVESEEDSDVDTGFYSDGEEAPPQKRRSLLVALRFVWIRK